MTGDWQAQAAAIVEKSIYPALDEQIGAANADQVEVPSAGAGLVEDSVDQRSGLTKPVRTDC